MRKWLLLGIFAMLAVLAVPALATEKPEAPADGHKMGKGSKGEVIFNHTTHKTVECGTCHHPVEGKEDYRPCSTAGCHDVFGQKAKGVNSYYQAIHKRKDPQHQSCLACHYKEAGEDQEKLKLLKNCKLCHQAPAKA